MSKESVVRAESAQHSIRQAVDGRKRVLIFSPDKDLARFLILNLEDRFHITRVSEIESLETAIAEVSPHLVLLDLFTFPQDIVRQCDIVRRMHGSVPIIALRAYVTLREGMDKSIDEVADVVFYKPVDGELISQSIEDLLK